MALYVPPKHVNKNVDHHFPNLAHKSKFRVVKSEDSEYSSSVFSFQENIEALDDDTLEKLTLHSSTVSDNFHAAAERLQKKVAEIRD